MSKFAEGFYIGASTAAHQVEGNNIHSDYWAMEQMEYSSFVEPSLDAVDHYNRYEQDIKMLADAGCNAYRFSIEWARVEPEKGFFDEAEVEHYRKVIKCCHENSVEAIVTLHHFTSPKWLICEGGWDDEKVVAYFAHYAKYIAEQLGDEIHYICTINEANMRLQIKAISERFMKQMQAKMAAEQTKEAVNKQEDTQNINLEGQVQVGINLNNPMERMKLTAMENVKIFGTAQPHTFVSSATEEGDLIVIKAHQAAKEAIKSVKPNLKVGITLSVHDIQFVEGGEERALHEWEEEFTHYIPYIKNDDFFGLQNYTRSIYGLDGILPIPEGAERTQMDYEVYPEALENVIRRVNGDMPGVDIMITENGIGTANDAQRITFIQKALCGVKNCIEDGIPVIGYCHWSLMDNFEWQKGYQMTFGLCAVDRNTQCRMPKASLDFLGSYAKSF